MLGLRSKILLGFGGLLALFAAVTLLGNVLLSRYSSVTRRMVREDLDGVVAAQRMMAAIDDIDDILQAGDFSDAARRAIEQRTRDFDDSFDMQSRGATLPGEQAATDRLAALWKQFQVSAQQLLGGAMSPEQRRALYATQVAPGTREIKASTKLLFQINVDNVRSAHGQLYAAANRAKLAMHALWAAGGALALVFALLIGRFILGPIRALTESVQQIRAGNLNLSVPVRADDELGKLATAFNEMAAQLRIFRRIDHEKLIRTQRTTQLAIDSLPDGVVVINPAGTIELVNETAQRLFDLSPGLRVGELSDKRLADLYAQASTRVVAAPSAGYGSAIKIADQGQARFFLPKAAPIVDEQKQTIGLTVVLSDVTEFRRLDEMKTGLLGLVSHELKTPLTSMRMILPLLVDGRVGPLLPKQRELLVAARDDADRLHRIVESLLDMGRIEAGQELMELRPVNAQMLLRECAAPVRELFIERGVRLEIDVPDEAANLAVQPIVLADATRIAHVFANLLGNAARYTPAGGTVNVGWAGGDGEVEFYVTDSGVGIPRQYMGRIFEKFFRVPGQPGDSGSGLGLAIVKDIIEAHGGRVTAESKPERGTTFRFTLQKAVAANEQDGVQPRDDAREIADGSAPNYARASAPV